VLSPGRELSRLAFNLVNVRQIHAMWQMISELDIRTSFDVVEANDRTGYARVVDT
jgi:hypothetical protein